MVQWLSTFFRLRPQQPSRIRSSTASSPPLVMFWTCLYELIINCVFFNTVDYVKVDLYTILKWSSNCLCLGLVSFFFWILCSRGLDDFFITFICYQNKCWQCTFQKGGIWWNVFLCRDWFFRFSFQRCANVLVRFRHKSHLVRVRKRLCFVLKYLFWLCQTRLKIFLDLVNNCKKLIPQTGCSSHL